MLNKKEVKDIQSLSQKKFRDDLGLFVAEGPKIVTELVAVAPAQVHRLYALPDWAHTHESLVCQLPLTVVGATDLQRLSGLAAPNAVVGVFRQFPQRPPAANGFALYLDTIQDPGNLGTIIRIADWFAVSGIVCSAGCADRYNPKVVQSTMASLARVPVYEDADGSWLSGQAVAKYAAVLEGRSVYGQPAVKKGILLIGNESRGLSPSLLEQATELITIPRLGAAESLNAAVATGILLSHLLS